MFSPHPNLHSWVQVPALPVAVVMIPTNPFSLFKPFYDAKAVDRSLSANKIQALHLSQLPSTQMGQQQFAEALHTRPDSVHSPNPALHPSSGSLARAESP